MDQQQSQLVPSQFGEEQTFTDKLKANFFELLEFVAIVGVIVLVVHYFIAEPHQVSGSSMVPNFHNGEYIITNKLATRFKPIHRSEVLIFNSPRPQESKVFIKRLVGLPGDRLKITSGKVFLNGSPVKEDYLPSGTLTQTESFLSEGEEITIPEGQYFMLGDNRGGSSDSREWGPIKKELIIGEAYFRYWPLSRIGLIKQD